MGFSVAGQTMTATGVRADDARRRRHHRVTGRGSRQAKIALFVVDLLTVSLSAVVVLRVVGAPAGGDPDRVPLTVLTIATWMVLLVWRRLYKRRFVDEPIDEVRRIVDVAVGATAVVLLVSFALAVEPDRGWLLALIGTLLLVMVLERSLARLAFRAMRAKGGFRQRVVVAGDCAGAEPLLSMLTEQGDSVYEIVRRIDIAPGATDMGVDLEQSLLAAVDEEDAGGVLLVGTTLPAAEVRRLTRVLHAQGTHVELIPQLCDMAAHRLTVHSIGGVLVLYLEQVTRRGWRQWAKRCFDFTVSAVALIVLSPLFVLTAIGIKLDSPGPILFRQKRVGRDFEPFEILKFRTMVDGADALRDELLDLNEADGPLFKVADDPRVTRLGRLLRRSSIDELPQLWNVLRGDMSLVGPRPATLDEVREWSDELNWRVRVAPGITGMWQVYGRSDCSFEQYTRLDLYYVDNWSLPVDIMLLARTIPVVLARRGAY
jgi:exopolysaccharide biosynthesis polyprenyl glycosylphosphotransferase